MVVYLVVSPGWGEGRSEFVGDHSLTHEVKCWTFPNQVFKGKLVIRYIIICVSVYVWGCGGGRAKCVRVHAREKREGEGGKKRLVVDQNQKSSEETEHSRK